MAVVFVASGERAAVIATLGFKLIAVGSDTGLLRAGAEAALKPPAAEVAPRIPGGAPLRPGRAPERTGSP